MSSKRRVKLLLDDARRKSHNVRKGTNYGIQDREALSYINEAYRKLKSMLFIHSTPIYQSKGNISLTAGTATYTLPSRLFLDGKIVSIKYSNTGQWTSDNYTCDITGPISQEQRNFYSGVPEHYFFEDGKIGFSPIPERTISNGIQIIYRDQAETLDLRRGVIHSDTTLNGSNNTITTLKIDPSGTPFDSNSTILEEDYICIVDKDGVSLMRDIPISALNTSTGVITVVSGFTYEDGETAPAGAYIVSGINATTHSKLSQDLDDYLVDYTALQLMTSDVNDLQYQLRAQAIKDREQEIRIMHSTLGLTENFHPVPGG